MGSLPTDSPSLLRKTVRYPSMTTFPRFENALLLAIGAVLATHPALAQRGAEVTVEVGECLEIEAATERLACFERRVE